MRGSGEHYLHVVHLLCLLSPWIVYTMSASVNLLFPNCRGTKVDVPK